MIKKLIGVVLIFILVIGMPSVQGIASGIDLEGQFVDWQDKPYLVDNIKDPAGYQDIVKVGWFPDPKSESLYLYSERRSGSNEDGKGRKFEDWDFDVFLQGENGLVNAKVHYHPPSRQVDVRLMDEKGKYLWSVKGKWGEDKDAGQKVEFYIPLNFMVSSTSAGYTFDLYFESGQNRIPGEGTVKISTVSTFPYQSSIVLFLVALLGMAGLLYKRERKNASHHTFFRMVRGSSLFKKD